MNIENSEGLTPKEMHKGGSERKSKVPKMENLNKKICATYPTHWGKGLIFTIVPYGYTLIHMSSFADLRCRYLVIHYEEKHNTEIPKGHDLVVCDNCGKQYKSSE